VPPQKAERPAPQQSVADAMAAHHALEGMNGRQRRIRRDPSQDLLDQCRRAARGADDGGGMNYFDVPF
jgi:hypothetical protein